MNKHMWNFIQRSRGVLKLKPLGCLSNRSLAFCAGCKSGQYYECQACGYLQPWCKGAFDEYFTICDDCWAIAESMHKAIGIPMEHEQ